MPQTRLDGWRVRLGPPRGGSGRLGLRLTRPGGVYLGAVCLIGLAAFNASVNLLFLVFGIALGVVIVANSTARSALRRVEVTREAPDAVLAGRPFTIRYRIRNTRKLGDAHSIRLSEDAALDGSSIRIEGYVETVRPGHTVTLDVQAEVNRRGVLRFSTLQLSSRFPFGLFERRLRVAAEHETVVFPALLRLRKRLDKPARAAAVMAQTSAGRDLARGEDEFYGLREYRAGDSLRRVHWRRSARTGQLVVREMADVRPRVLLVVVDAHQPGDRGRDASEAAVSAAGTLLCHGLEMGYKVGLVAAGRSPVIIPPTIGRGLRARLMHQLALLEPAGDDGLEQLVASHRWPPHWRGRCIVVGTSGRPALWRAANALMARYGAAEVVAAGGPDFASWFEAEPRPPAEDRLETAPC